VHSDDGFSLSIGGFNLSYPGGRSPGETLQTFYFAAPGEYPLELIYFEMTGGAEAELFAAPGVFTAWEGSFRLVGDTAGGGLAVQAPVVASGAGSGNYRPYINTDVQSQMNGVNASAYLRFPFTVSAPGALQSLSLRLMYDDGFIAYLNGQKVAERNAPASPQWNSSALTAHPSSLVFENINISDRLSALQTGTNVLAIQGLNQAAGDPDFLILPELLEYRLTNTTANYFAVPSPDGPNASGFLAVVGDTKFSVSRGFYDTPFSLAITTATANATIRFTTNGSTPSPTNGTIYTGPLTISGTTVIRAAAFKAGYLPSNVDTESYIFVNDVIRQSPNGQAPAGWPASWGANVVDYGMDPDVVNAPAYSGTLSNGLKSLPAYCIVTDLENLFDPTTGIYANAGQDGIEWERPASIELIYPDGTKGFHINAGLRVRGGYSRSTSNPKHAFRFFFRQAYGASKLDYPAFARQGGAEVFDSYDLRTSQNYSWSFGGDYRYIALRDQFSRDTQLAQGQPGERGDFYHLYINGQYWGLYNTDERAEAAYGASYLGGKPEEFDVVKVDTSAGYTIMATDGNLDAWTRLWRAATNGFASDADYFKVQGLNADGTPNATYENLLEVDNLIDYMLVIFFTGNIDAPVSQFIGNSNPNNTYAMRNRTGQYGGFRFFLHDSEHT
ncbi:MAG TPA: chitobiase/beta-hexosaminidase C-terminal domain-containing protein, partial [Candidatus Sulfotelmatobacter sp.]|nr:chitobiase/beta-hexosaminidase C-terminal domain-containing protein [Candidatus Sulfotelmatobacter sp.]